MVLNLLKELAGISYNGLKSNFTRLDKPYKLNFAITMWCQSRCLTCNIWELKPKGELSLDEIREFAKKNNSFRWIGLTGGEPFLRGDIVDIVKTFKENSKGLYILTIPTNSLCNQDMVVKKITEMLELELPKVVITLSLDGNRETHDRVRGVPGNYDKVIKMYKALSELKKNHKNLSFVFGYTLSKMNQGQLQKTYEDVKAEIPGISYNDFHINVAQLSNNYYHNTSNTIIADRDVAVGELKNAFNNRKREFGAINTIENQFLKGLIQFAETGKAPVKCRSLDASLFMDNFGNIYPSIMWDRNVANLRDIEYDLSKAWHNGEATEIRKLIQEGKDPVHWTSCEAYQSIIGNRMQINRSIVASQNNSIELEKQSTTKSEVAPMKAE